MGFFLGKVGVHVFQEAARDLRRKFDGFGHGRSRL
jgi:hypothetical protein